MTASTSASLAHLSLPSFLRTLAPGSLAAVSSRWVSACSSAVRHSSSYLTNVSSLKN